MTAHCIDVTEANFMQEVIEASRRVPVLVDVLLDTGDLAEAQRLLEEIAEGAKDRGRLDSLAARLTLANLLALKQDYRGALEELLEIVRRDRAFQDDAGRRTMLQIFSVLGSDSDLMREYRARLSSLINR